MNLNCKYKVIGKKENAIKFFQCLSNHAVLANGNIFSNLDYLDPEKETVYEDTWGGFSNISFGFKPLKSEGDNINAYNAYLLLNISDEIKNHQFDAPPFQINNDKYPLNVLVSCFFAEHYYCVDISAATQEICNFFLESATLREYWSHICKESNALICFFDDKTDELGKKQQWKLTYPERTKCTKTSPKFLTDDEGFISVDYYYYVISKEDDYLVSKILRKYNIKS